MNTLTTVVVRPSRGFRGLQLAELWEYRELLFFLAWRDVKVRYKQTMLGAAWAVLQPLLTMLVFTLFFGRLAHMPSDGLPYSLFAYTALVPWQFCALAVTQSGNSLVANQGLITKAYFPRLVVPLASVLASLVDFAVASLLLAIEMRVPRLPLAGGRYALDVLLAIPHQWLDYIEDACFFDVEESDPGGTGYGYGQSEGFVHIDHAWASASVVDDAETDGAIKT